MVVWQMLANNSSLKQIRWLHVIVMNYGSGFYRDVGRQESGSSLSLAPLLLQGLILCTMRGDCKAFCFLAGELSCEPRWRSGQPLLQGNELSCLQCWQASPDALQNIFWSMEYIGLWFCDPGKSLVSLPAYSADPRASLHCWTSGVCVCICIWPWDGVLELEL